MTSGGKRTGTVGYNVQTAVDTKHHLIVEHEVTNIGGDHGQLSRIASSAKSAMGKPKRLIRPATAAQTSICPAISRASSTSMPSYRTS